jgi:hypothetical protein
MRWGATKNIERDAVDALWWTAAISLTGTFAFLAVAEIGAAIVAFVTN